MLGQEVNRVFYASSLPVILYVNFIYILFLLLLILKLLYFTADIFF